MNSTVSTHDPAQLVATVRQLMRDRAGLPAERTLFEINRALGGTEWQDTGSGPGTAQASPTARAGHRPWCTEHLTADPADPLTEGSDECVTTVRAVEPGGTWRAGLEVMAAQAPDGEDDLTVTLEGDQGRAMTLLEAERLHSALGQLIAVARRA